MGSKTEFLEIKAVTDSKAGKVLTSAFTAGVTAGVGTGVLAAESAEAEVAQVLLLE